MAIDFPNSPSSGDIYTVNGKQWQWDGEKWIAYGVSLAPDVLKVDTGNNRVGINQLAPTVALDVTGSARITGDLTVSGTTVTVDSATVLIKDRISFEGATADGYETTLVATDPTGSDKTITLPNATGTVTLDGAPLASPTFTGVPAAPTASANTSSTQVATTAFVMTEVGDYAPLASPTLTGVPAAPTAAADTNTTQIATTAYVQTELGAVSSDSIADADSDTKIQVEEGSDEDIIRFDTAGTEQMTIKADGTITLTQGLDDVNAVLAVQIFR